MSDLKKFENQDQQDRFFHILKNGMRTFLSTGLIIFGAMWLAGIVGNTNHHFACNAENVVKHNRENYFLRDGNYFNGGDFQTQDFVLKGKNSLKLTAENPFGFGFNYEFLKGNEEVVAWVWRYAEGDWKVNGKIAGKIRVPKFTTGGDFNFLQMHNAGHMVPMDQPENALAMVQDFLNGGFSQN